MVVVATLRSSLCFVEATADDSILDTVNDAAWFCSSRVKADLLDGDGRWYGDGE